MTEKLVSLQDFTEAVSALTASPVGPRSHLWKDLGLWGDDFWELLVRLSERFPGIEYEADITQFVPDEGEITLFGKYCGAREIPDLTLQEFYAFAKFNAGVQD